MSQMRRLFALAATAAVISSCKARPGEEQGSQVLEAGFTYNMGVRGLKYMSAPDKAHEVSIQVSQELSNPRAADFKPRCRAPYDFADLRQLQILHRAGAFNGQTRLPNIVWALEISASNQLQAVHLFDIKTAQTQVVQPSGFQRQYRHVSPLSLICLQLVREVQLPGPDNGGGNGGGGNGGGGNGGGGNGGGGNGGGGNGGGGNGGGGEPPVDPPVTPVSCYSFSGGNTNFTTMNQKADACRQADCMAMTSQSGWQVKCLPKGAACSEIYMSGETYQARETCLSSPMSCTWSSSNRCEGGSGGGTPPPPSQSCSAYTGSNANFTAMNAKRDQCQQAGCIAMTSQSMWQVKCLSRSASCQEIYMTGETFQSQQTCEGFSNCRWNTTSRRCETR